MPFQGVLQFKGGIDGWSETYYPMANSTIDEAHTHLQALAEVRARCVAPPSELFYLRTSDINVKRDALRSLPNTRNNPLLGEDGADANFVALLLRWSSGSLFTRAQYMRGIPDFICTTGGTYTPSGQWTQPFTAFLHEMTSGRWGIRTQQPLGPVSVTAWSVDQGDALKAVFVTAADIAVIVGTIIRVRNGGNGNVANGRYIVTDVTDPRHFKAYRYPKPLPQEGYWVPQMIVERIDTVIQVINRINIRGITHRDQGRPFGAHRGRRRVRAAS